jgi:hypothetical protein
MNYVSARMADDSQLIVDDLSAPQVEYHAIPLADLESFLNKRGLLRQIKGIIDTTTNADLKNGLTDFLEHLSSRSVNLDVPDAEVRAKFVAVLDALSAVLPDSATSFVEIKNKGIENYTLADRLVGGAVTVSDVDDAKQRVKLTNQLNTLFHSVGDAIPTATSSTSLSSIVTPLLPQE